MTKPKLLSIKEVAYELEMDRGTVLRAIKKGQILGTRIGRNWKIPAAEVDKILYPSCRVTV